jgi:hypothetical protein
VTTATAVSVVVATYNGERHLRDQLLSVLDQTVVPLEIIVSDDCSTDSTIEVASEVARSSAVPIRVDRNPQQLGYAENFLRAALAAAGDLIAFADQDDVWLPDKLAQATAAFRADPRLMAWCHASRVVDEELRPVPDRRFHTGIARRAARANPLHPLHGSHLVFRAELLRWLPPNDRPASVYGGHPAEHDEWVTFAAHALGRIGWHGAPLMLYRRHGSAVTQVADILSRSQVIAGVEETRTNFAVEAARQRAAYLEARSRAPECEPVRGTLSAAAERYRRLEPRLVRRVRTRQATGTTRRLRSLAGAVLRRDYTSPGRGGLGAWALVQDAYRSL